MFSDPTSDRATISYFCGCFSGPKRTANQHNPIEFRIEQLHWIIVAPWTCQTTSKGFQLRLQVSSHNPTHSFKFSHYKDSQSKGNTYHGQNDRPWWESVLGVVLFHHLQSLKLQPTKKVGSYARIYEDGKLIQYNSPSLEPQEHSKTLANLNPDR